MLIDPLTPLWQDVVRKEDAWAGLSFGRSAALTPSDLIGFGRGDELIESVVRFQIEHGATAIIPPYVHANRPDDPWFEVTLQLLRRTARFMGANRIKLPLVPVLSAVLQGFCSKRRRRDGLDRFIDVAVGIGPQALAICFSPVTAKDHYDKVLRLFDAYDYLRRATGLPILGWRQGFFGPGLVAAGLAGYETGIATSEFCDMARVLRSRRPRPDGEKSGGGGLGIYVDPLGRTVPPGPADVLLGHTSFRSKVMCDDQRCCPNGVLSTREHRRQHAVRTRARALATLDALPHTSWRLHQVAKDARQAETLAKQANRILEVVDQPKIATNGYESLANVTEHLRREPLGLEAA